MRSAFFRACPTGYSRTVIEAAIAVRDNPQAGRYELVLDGGVVGELVYRQRPEARVFLHTEISDELEGRGLGARLVESALDDVRAHGLKLAASLPLRLGYLRRHPTYADLVL